MPVSLQPTKGDRLQAHLAGAPSCAQALLQGGPLRLQRASAVGGQLGGREARRVVREQHAAGPGGRPLPEQARGLMLHCAVHWTTRSEYWVS